jgi:SAM-dependent methyltransferase
MGQYVDLLRSLPKTKRDINSRAADRSPEVIAKAREYGYDYFDGDRKYGYGGYKYDGRWVPVARDIAAHYRLPPQSRVLDVGCAKGFLVADMCRPGTGPGLDAYGVDISHYAVKIDPDWDVVGRLHLDSADYLPFPDKSFDLVFSINTLHNLRGFRLLAALREMKRVSRGGMFVQVDSYHTPEEKALFESWVLTAETHGTPEFWLELFAEAGYDGDYAWTTITT